MKVFGVGGWQGKKEWIWERSSWRSLRYCSKEKGQGKGGKKEGLPFCTEFFRSSPSAVPAWSGTLLSSFWCLRYSFNVQNLTITIYHLFKSVYAINKLLSKSWILHPPSTLSPSCLDFSPSPHHPSPENHTPLFGSWLTPFFHSCLPPASVFYPAP